MQYETGVYGFLFFGLIITYIFTHIFIHLSHNYVATKTLPESASVPLQKLPPIL